MSKKTSKPSSAKSKTDRGSLYVFLVVGMTVFLILLLIFPLSTRSWFIEATLAVKDGRTSDQGVGQSARTATAGSIQQCHQCLLDELRKFGKSAGLDVSEQSDDVTQLTMADNSLVTKSDVDETSGNNQLTLYLRAGDSDETAARMASLLTTIVDFNQRHEDVAAAEQLEVARLRTETEAQEQRVRESRRQVDTFIEAELNRRRDTWTAEVAEKQKAQQVASAPVTTPSDAEIPEPPLKNEPAATPRQSEWELTKEIGELQRSLLKLLVNELPEHPDVVEVEQQIKQLKTQVADIRRESIPSETQQSPSEKNVVDSDEASPDFEHAAAGPSLEPTASADEVPDVFDSRKVRQEIEISTEVADLRAVFTAAERELDETIELFNQATSTHAQTLENYTVVNPAKVVSFTEGPPDLARFCQLIIGAIVVGVGFSGYRVREETSETFDQEEQVDQLIDIPITGLLSKPDGPPIVDTSINRHSLFSRSAVAFGELTLIVLFCVMFVTAVIQKGFGQQFAADPFSAYVDAVYGAATLIRTCIPFV